MLTSTEPKKYGYKGKHRMRHSIGVLAGIVCVLACIETALATDYYVDAVDGRDSHVGTSLHQPWQTLDKVNSMVFKPGDGIYFKAGTRYRGQFKPKGSGTLIDGRPSRTA